MDREIRRIVGGLSCFGLAVSGFLILFAHAGLITETESAEAWVNIGSWAALIFGVSLAGFADTYLLNCGTDTGDTGA